ncbi:Kunitz-type trypsin inhibitor [Rhynchospora pubera]|uniref:Kunitz-type trypsin inhibitor n=1 Tax=Rhynchospora pubera TaxID=906938 RepID=A0AAV8DH46_9POAL|nr:Kunitz-type trypsin inhibitor [Rhynchospora pubera]
MKFPILTISLIVTFIPFSLLSNTATSTPVYDVDGEPLIPEIGYYILPLIRGSGGSVELHYNGSCPYYIAQAFSEVDYGFPSVWQLSDPEGDSGSRYVRVGRVLENPGEETVNRWFKIETHPRGDYKLVFCPTVCETCRPVCGDIGLLSQGDSRLLGLSDEPYRVVFKRKED